MPVPGNAPIEGDPNPGNGDRHVLVLDNGNCFLYELYNLPPMETEVGMPASAAVWDLLGNEQRPWTWTSADAAGLPIFPGLVRYDEVAAGQIQHAIAVHSAAEPGGHGSAGLALGSELDRFEWPRPWA